MPFPENALDITKLQPSELRRKLAEFREYPPSMRATYVNLDAFLEQLVCEIERLKAELAALKPECPTAGESVAP